ncbi:MAG: hypothetical protein RLZZ161_1547 [Bacteroidota bacterium]
MRKLLLIHLFLTIDAAFAQVYPIQKTNQNILIDGDLSEEVWQKSPLQGGFIQHFPYDTSGALTQTQFMLTYDDNRLYAAFICINRNPDKPFVVQSLKRDFSITQSDAVVLTLSPFADGQNGFSFGVTPQNAQREGAVENGGGFGVSTAWDQIWYSATRITRDTWFAEFEIPFKSLRFPDGLSTWRFNVARSDFRNNEVSTWIKVPRMFNISALTFTGTLQWPTSPARKGPNLALIPYVSSLATGEKGEFLKDNTPRVGLDAKVGLSSSLNLDVTINPDFAQVDVDEQQINLTRFSLFFPERRQFFIENSDLFAQFGFRQIRPFFSRRIGLSQAGNIPIDAGAKITGKIGKDLRVGVMDVQTRRMDSLNPAKNYAVAAFQRKVLAASYLGGILVSEQTIGATNAKRKSVAGMEFNLLTPTNRWVGKAFVQKALYDGLKADKGYAHASFLVYRTLKWEAMWNHEYVSGKFRAPTGFVPRIENYDPVLRKTFFMSYGRLEPMISRIFYPKSSVINNFSVNLYNSTYTDSNYRITEAITTFSGKMLLQNSASFRLAANREFFWLFQPFNPVNPRDTNFLSTGEYHFQSMSASATSNNRKPLNGSLECQYGTYFGGEKLSLTVATQYRFQPRFLFTINYRRIDIDIPRLGKSTLNLVGAKTEYSLNTIMYFTAFLQYNTQAQNVNINVRYQWRYRPMSDFFVVYSENYDPQFLAKNRSLAFKWVYWFNT